MEEMNIFLLNFALLLLDIIGSLSCALLCDALLHSKVTFGRKAIAFVAMLVASYIITLIPVLSSFPIKQVLLVILLTGYCHVSYRGGLTLKFLCSIFSYSILLIADTAAIFAFVNIQQKSREEIFASQGSYFLCAAFTHLIIFAVCFSVWKFLHTRNKLSSLSLADWCAAIIFLLISIITMAILFRETVHEGTVSNLVIMDIIGLLGADIALMFLLNRIEQEGLTRQENLILRRELKTQNDSAEALSRLYSQQRKMTHDFKSHLSTIKYLLAQNKVPDINKYLDDLLRTEQLNSIVIDTNNPIIDAVLNQKYSVAQSFGIQMEFEVNDLSHFPLSNEECVVILSNLLDNAIEACSGCHGEKLIRVRMKKEKYESILSVVNTTSDSIDVSDHLPATTKPVKILHGYGLQNVCSILEQHGAFPALECQNGWFQFSTVLS